MSETRADPVFACRIEPERVFVRVQFENDGWVAISDIDGVNGLWAESLKAMSEALTTAVPDKLAETRMVTAKVTLIKDRNVR